MIMIKISYNYLIKNIHKRYLDYWMFKKLGENKPVAGSQLLKEQGMATPFSNTTFWGATSPSRIKQTPKTNGWCNFEQIALDFGNFNTTTTAIKDFATSTTYTLIVELDNVKDASGILALIQTNQATESFGSYTVVKGASISAGNNVSINLEKPDPISVIVVKTKATLGSRGLRFFTRNNVGVGTTFDIRTTVLLGDHANDWEKYCGNYYQSYVGD